MITSYLSVGVLKVSVGMVVNNSMCSWLREVLSFALALVVLFYLNIRVDGGVSLLHLIVFGLIALLSFMVRCWTLNRTDHKDELFSSTESIVGATSASKPQRNIAIDWIRLIALLFVICVHSIDNVMPFLTISVDGEEMLRDTLSQSAILFYSFVRTVMLSCNALYVMISGALLLPYRKEHLLYYYFHRYTKMIIPMLVFYVFYLWQSNGLPVGSAISVGTTILYGFFTGQTAHCPFYWMLYIIALLYLVYPFLRLLFKRISYSFLTALATLIIFCAAVSEIWLNHSILSTPVIWLAFAVLGYWITRTESARFDRVILIMAALSAGIFAAVIIQRRVYVSYINYLVYFTPMLMFICLGFFSLARKLLALRNRFSKLGARVNLCITFFNQYGFAILLAHWWCLYHCPTILTELRDSISVSLGLHMTLLFVIVTDILIAVVLGFIMNNYVIRLPMLLADYLVKMLNRVLRQIDPLNRTLKDNG